MISIPRRSLTLTTATLALFATGTLRAQPLDARTVNMEGTWTPLAHDLHFAFAHRFEIAGEDEGVGDILDDGKVVNYPTFALTYGIAPGISAGTRYSTNSLIADRANEWQPFVKFVPVKDAAGVSVSLLGAYNTANESWDGEASAQLDRGPLTLIAAVRGFSSPLVREEEEEAELAIGAGGSIALNRYLALNADYANMVTEDAAQIGWSAGLAAQIPYTPHTLALYATNVSSGTLEGASVGIDDAVLWGFEFTIPFSGHRWGRLFDPGDEAPAAAAPSAAPAVPAEGSDPAGAVVEVNIKDLKFDGAEIRLPVGGVVRWTNRDPLAHTTTSVDGAWDSGLIEPGESFERTFDRAGRFEYLCTPHPFMKAAVVVEEGGTGA
ncbi:MAG TPA: cupredoxin family copper-binding protein [Gemmatimonadota bacterium]|nr:cupredoxin family copper-binding protein [Gemmatimonadota bacterium]